MSPTTILCVVANDAAPGDEHRVRYTGVGLNYQERMMDALVWVSRNEANVRTWAFGAGTDAKHRYGPMLAVHCEAYLKLISPDETTLVNQYSQTHWGTLEEMAWIVAAVGDLYQPGEVEFVFFTQSRHMLRVKFIWWLFYQKRWGKARFVVTRHNKQLSIIHEIGGLRKAWRVYKGYEKPRYQVGYPDQGNTEC